MFAHVVTAKAQSEDFANLAGFIREQLPDIPQQPGFRGFYLLRDSGLDKLMTISLWESEDDVRASIARAASQASDLAGLTEVRGDTYEIVASA